MVVEDEVSVEVNVVEVLIVVGFPFFPVDADDGSVVVVSSAIVVVSAPDVVVVSAPVVVVAIAFVVVSAGEVEAVGVVVVVDATTTTRASKKGSVTTPGAGFESPRPLSMIVTRTAHSPCPGVPTSPSST